VVGIRVHEWSEHKFRECVREVTGRSRGVCFDGVFLELVWFMRGWVSYFGLVDVPYKFVGYVGWVRSS